MRSVSLFAVLVLVFVLAASAFRPAAASGSITIVMVTTNGDTTTGFEFHMWEGGAILAFFYLVGGMSRTLPDPDGGVVYSVNDVDVAFGGPGVVNPSPLYNTWRVQSIVCTGTSSSFQYWYASVEITYVGGDVVTCTFTHAPRTPPTGSPPAPSPPVGGVVIPANTLALVAPWIAVIGLVGCIGTAVVIAKRRRP